MWQIEKIYNYTDNRNFGFHDLFGNRYALDFDNHWVGRVDGDGFKWTIGVNQNFPNHHIDLDMEEPTYLSGCRDGSLLVVSSGNKKIYKILLEGVDVKEVKLLIDCEEVGMKDVGNCEWDRLGNLWVNEIKGCRVWKFDKDGNPLNKLGNGEEGFQRTEVSFDEVRFSWIYDLRRGPDGNIYVLDSKNYALRKINVDKNTVELVAGTGESGYSGDGGDCLRAKFGGNRQTTFDGPWSLALDEEGNIYIGDTQNHVVRMIYKETNTIDTIAGKPNAEEGKRNNYNEDDPLNLNLPLICSLEYYNGKLIIPEWDGDLIILRKVVEKRK